MFYGNDQDAPFLSIDDQAMLELDRFASELNGESELEGSLPKKYGEPATLKAAVSTTLRKIKFRLDVNNVYPGQDDREIERLLREWKKSNNKDIKAAAWCYAGALSATQPDHGDAYDGWLSSCTDLQRDIFAKVRKWKVEKRRKEEKAEYERKKLSETGKPVREYVKGRPKEERAARNAANAKAYRERKKLARQSAERPDDDLDDDLLDDVLLAELNIPA
ncbi:hypothetical protein NX862_14465 [Rhodobacter sp. KR11]|uniref:hypothetical protein n=1 Tax=Rhodobacter sp. KR11 TaxID=2974588 RepID=UPI0022234DDA|nr:hypothetical protein [Rhodobacter sp. KR11]MCW1919961.1 hypothetical protein [Rhodobacter sp. KR11]